MISSISLSGGGSIVDSYVPYASFNNNGYLIDENLNSVQNDRLQRVAKQFSELGNKMVPNDSIEGINGGAKSIGASNERYAQASKTNEEQLSTSTEDSNSSGSFKNGGQAQEPIDSKNDDEKAMPDHHARRPMNAFLIFCKRHRGIVRERYPNLENRAITKILGDWWANLNDIEKSSYTNLAKEYKDAFFNANPDFKWYKLPAPPLRTGCHRMVNDRHSLSSDHDDHNSDYEMNHPIKTCIKRNESSGMSTFKFADEAQMGGLSSLMATDKCANIDNNNSKFMANSMEIDESKDKDGDVSDSKDELQRVLGETNSFLQTTMKGYDHPDVYPFEMNTTNDNIPRKSFHDSSPEMKNFELDSPDDDNGYDSVFGSKKSSRACKGKRYMEFMNAHKLSMINKRAKPRTASTSSSTSLSPTQPLHVRSLKKSMSCSQAVQQLDYETFDHLYANHSATILPPASLAMKNGTDASGKSVPSSEQLSPLSASDNRKPDVTEFELEHRINSLQAHNLDEYLLRKQDTKKKKKVNDKRSGGANRKMHRVAKQKMKTSPVAHAIATATSKTIEEAKARLIMVGSQKRKARKESITRRDVQQVTAIVQSYLPALDPQFVPLNLAPFRNSVPSINQPNRCGNSGLLMLATMAEAAAANYAN